MPRRGAMSETDFIKRRKWLLVSTILLALCALIVSLVFLGRIKGWVGGRDEMELLTVIDREHPVPSALSLTLSFIDDEHMVDTRCAAEAERMLAACRLAGHEPMIKAAYLSESAQRELLNALAESYMAEGRDAVSARALALQSIDEPGYSEHQLGLALDIADAREEQRGGTQRWLSEHAWEYGFILRYPAGKESLTHHGASPEHYRFVGAEAAKQIYELNITLEEYLGMFYSN